MLQGAALFEVVLFLIALPAALGIYATRYIGVRAKQLGRAPTEVRAERIILTVVWVSIAVAGFYLAFGTFSLFPTLTVSAIAGLALSLSLQTTLQNIIAGSMLLRGRFLRVGDAIQYSGVKGRVASIGLVTVVVKADDGTLSMVSNSSLLSGPLTNFTASSRLAGEY